MVSNAGEGGSSGEEEETGDQTDIFYSEPTRISHLQASIAIDTIMPFFEQNELAMADDIHHLSVTIQRVDFMCLSSQKQTTIADLFRTSC